MSEALNERLVDWKEALHVERDARLLRNVALAGENSQNGYRYSTAALQQAVPLYEGVPVFLDHPASTTQPRQRSTRDLAGRVRNVRFEQQRLRGDIELVNTDAGRTLLALAESNGPGVGMSHVVLAQRSANGKLVEQILEVISVDSVVYPATTTSFRESKAERPIAASPHRTKTTSAKPPQRALPGSLERLLEAIDSQLPDAARLLAERTGCRPGRIRRIALYPRQILVEWRRPGRPAETYRIPWRLDRRGVHLSARWQRVEQALDPIDTTTALESTWLGRLGAPRRTSGRRHDESSAPPPVLSRPRVSTTHGIDDAAIVRALKRY